MHKIERVSVAGCIWMISSELAGGEEGGGGGLSSGKPLCTTALLRYAACPRVCARPERKRPGQDLKGRGQDGMEYSLADTSFGPILY